MTLLHQNPHYLHSKSSTHIDLESPDGKKIASSLGLLKVADNRYICPSTKDFWKIDNGKLLRTSATEVDNDESMEAANASSPEAFLASLLADLEF